MKMMHMMQLQPSLLPGVWQHIGCFSMSLLVHVGETDEEEDAEGRWEQVGLVGNVVLQDVQEHS